MWTSRAKLKTPFETPLHAGVSTRRARGTEWQLARRRNRNIHRNNGTHSRCETAHSLTCRVARATVKLIRARDGREPPIRSCQCPLGDADYAALDARAMDEPLSERAIAESASLASCQTAPYSRAEPTVAAATLRAKDCPSHRRVIWRGDLAGARSLRGWLQGWDPNAKADSGEQNAEIASHPHRSGKNQ
jgi:hypothetical protein